MASIVTGTWASTTWYSIPSMVHGYHEYLHVWDAVIGEILLCNNKDANLYDPYAMTVKKGAITVGHVPKRFHVFVPYFWDKEDSLIVKWLDLGVIQQICPKVAYKCRAVLYLPGNLKEV